MSRAAALVTAGKPQLENSREQVCGHNTDLSFLLHTAHVSMVMVGHCPPAPSHSLLGSSQKPLPVLHAFKFHSGFSAGPSLATPLALPFPCGTSLPSMIGHSSLPRPRAMYSVPPPIKTLLLFCSGLWAVAEVTCVMVSFPGC